MAKESSISKSYSIKEVLVVLTQNRPTGPFSYALETFEKVTPERKNDRVSHKEAATGQIVANLYATVLGSVKFAIPQTADGDRVMREIEKNQHSFASLGSGKTSVSIKDLLGNELHILTDGLIIKPPAKNYGKDCEDREWTIEGILQDAVDITPVP